jgi:Astacin (Peptidase family M12A)
MRIKSAFNLALVAVMIMLTVSCNVQVESSTVQNQTKIAEIRSVDNRFNPADSQLVEDSDQINYTFSNGEKISLYAMNQFLFAKGMETGLTSRSKFPDWVNAVEEQLNTGSAKTQGVGISIGAIDSRGKSALWPSAKNLGVIYYEIGSFPTGLRTAIDQAINQWNQTSVGVKWQPRISGSTYKYATIVGGNNASIAEWVIGGIQCENLGAFSGSGIGYSDPGTFPVAATIYINPNCFSILADPANNARTRAFVMHEMGHVTGLWHEFQRCGRSNYVNVAPNQSPYLVDQVIYFYNAAEKCDLNAANYGYYDFDSIMHYKYGGYLTSRTPANGNHCGVPSSAGYALTLSTGDVNAIARIYGRGPTTTNGC